MKYIVIYESTYVVGFTNSMENFKANNAKRTYPYSFDESELKLVELREDVFNLARIEGGSNFADYVNF